LYQLKAENRALEDNIATLTARRDHLLAVNARLSVPLSTQVVPGGGQQHAPNTPTGGGQTTSVGSDPDASSASHPVQHVSAVHDNGVLDDAPPQRHGKNARTNPGSSNFTTLRVRRHFVHAYSRRHRILANDWR
jgi:hypothetical protein